MLDRIKNPLFQAAAVAFLYNVTNYVTTTFFHVTIDPNIWLNFFQLLLWLALGAGIYANYTPTQTNQIPQTIKYEQPISNESVIVNPTPIVTEAPIAETAPAVAPATPVTPPA